MHIVTLTRPVVIGGGAVRARRGHDRHLADRLRRASCSANAAAWMPTSPPARRWESRSCIRGQIDWAPTLIPPRTDGDADAGQDGVRADPNGLPIHGVLAAYPGWRVTTESANELTAEVDFSADPELLASFPFPHRLTMTVTADRTDPDGSHHGHRNRRQGRAAVLRLPSVPAPAGRGRARVDHRDPAAAASDASTNKGCPPAKRNRQPASTEPLGDKTFDDAYDQVTDGAVFAVSGGGRRLEVHFEQGYPAAQIFAPPGEDVVCFEPMTAPTDALRRGGYRSCASGEPAVAQFSIRV